MEGNTRKQASPDLTENSMYRVQRKFGDAQSSHGILCPGEVQCGAGWNFFLQSIFSQRCVPFVSFARFSLNYHRASKLCLCPEWASKFVSKRGLAALGSCCRDMRWCWDLQAADLFSIRPPFSPLFPVSPLSPCSLVSWAICCTRWAGLTLSRVAVGGKS